MLFFVLSPSTFSAIKSLLLCVVEPFPTIALIVLFIKYHLFSACFGSVTLVKSNAKALLSASQQKCRQSVTVCALAEGSSACADMYAAYCVIHSKAIKFLPGNFLLCLSVNRHFIPHYRNRNVPHSCKYLLWKNHHRKLSGTPFSSRYFLRASSRSCSVSAVLYFV